VEFKSNPYSLVDDAKNGKLFLILFYDVVFSSRLCLFLLLVSLNFNHILNTVLFPHQINVTRISNRNIHFLQQIILESIAAAMDNF